MPQLSYALFDADNHYHEPRDCFSRYIEPRFRDKAVRVVENENRRKEIRGGDKPIEFLDRIDSLPESEIHRIMRDNALGLVDRS